MKTKGKISGDNIIIPLTDMEIPCNIPEQDYTELPPTGWHLSQMTLIRKIGPLLTFSGIEYNIEIDIKDNDTSDMVIGMQYIIHYEYGELSIYKQPLEA